MARAVAGSRALLIEVSWAAPLYHASGPWPPAPFRLFQALVAGAYGGRWAGEQPEHKNQAFRWLEALAPPWITASATRDGRAITYYVPNNSLDAVGGDPARVPEIRVPKSVRPRHILNEPSILYAWRFAEGEGEAATIVELADRLHTLGTGVDAASAKAELCDWTTAEERMAAHPGTCVTPSLCGAGRAEDPACPVPGSLQSLQRQYAEGVEQFTKVRRGRSTVTVLTRPQKPIFRTVAYDRPPTLRLFELRRTGAGLARWPVEDAVALVERTRDAAARLLALRLPDRAALVERFLIGRGAETTDKVGRIRLVPLPSIGMTFTDPAIRRLLLAIPADCPLPADEVAAVFPGLDLALSDFSDDLHLAEAADWRMVRHYGVAVAGERPVAPAQAWSTVTPAALPLERSGGRNSGADRLAVEVQAAQAVRTALRQAGITAQPTSIRVQREGWGRRHAHADSFARSPRFPARRLWHVSIAFAEPVSGPMVIGDGRYLGLGLMAPGPAQVRLAPPDAEALRFRIRPHEIALRSGDAYALTDALRRALMSLARTSDGGVHPMFSGHDGGPGPARSGRHAHVYLSAEDTDGDGHLDHLAVIAPWRVDRSWQPDAEQRADFARITAGLTRVTAGSLGVLSLAPPELMRMDTARTWTCTTGYQMTRHTKGRPGEAAIREDVALECARRGLPTPKTVEVVVAGKAETAPITITLTFQAPVRGPILLGRDAHRGGGRFRGVGRA
jgi:CRISPR-associated protein Csb2